MENRDLSLSNLDESDNYRYIYPGDYIRKLRDIYKKGTERTFDEVKTQVERDCEAKKQQASKESIFFAFAAGKAIALLNHCHQTLQELNDQRKFIGRILQKQAEQGKALPEQIRQEVHRRTLDESAMRLLLNELRQQNP